MEYLQEQSKSLYLIASPPLILLCEAEFDGNNDDEHQRYCGSQLSWATLDSLSFLLACIWDLLKIEEICRLCCRK